MEKSRHYNNIINGIFLMVLFLILCLCYLVVFRGQHLVSQQENRELQTVPKFSFSSFLKGDFQNQLEKSISDQLITGERIKSAGLKIKNESFFTQKKLLVNINSDLCKGYTSESSSLFAYNCNNYMMTKSGDLKSFAESLENMKKVAEGYNDISNVEKYLYFIENDRSINFDNDNTKENIFYQKVKEAYKMDNYANLKISSIKDYENYFYRTDHHWNYKGSYEGYKGIIKLLLGEDEKLLEPIKKTTYDFDFHGSRAREGGYYHIKENFTVYEYDIPKHKTLINGKKGNYGNQSEYKKGNYSTAKVENHYASYYGTDYEELIFDFNNPDKENLLIISSSFSNSVNELIASHFNKTYVIDMRFKSSFDIQKYIDEHDIDKFIFIGDLSTIWTLEFDLRKGKK